MQKIIITVFVLIGLFVSPIFVFADHGHVEQDKSPGVTPTVTQSPTGTPAPTSSPQPTSAPSSSPTPTPKPAENSTAKDPTPTPAVITFARSSSDRDTDSGKEKHEEPTAEPTPVIVPVHVAPKEEKFSYSVNKTQAVFGKSDVPLDKLRPGLSLGEKLLANNSLYKLGNFSPAVTQSLLVLSITLFAGGMATLNWDKVSLIVDRFLGVRGESGSFLSSYKDLEI